MPSKAWFFRPLNVVVCELFPHPLHLHRDALLLRQGEAILLGEDFAGEVVEGVADDVLAGAGAEDDADGRVHFSEGTCKMLGWATHPQ